MKSRKNTNRAFVIIALTTLVANLVHPVTPKYLEMRGVHNYMFGVAFAAMAIATVLTSTMWGNASDIKGRKIIMSIDFFLYALGQYLFSASTTEVGITIARFIGGAGGGGLGAIQLAYLSDCSLDHEKSNNLVVAGALTAIVSSFGYLVGGVLGDHIGIINVFLIQTAGLSALGIYAFFIPEEKEKKPLNVRKLLKESKALTLDDEAISTPSAKVFFTTVFLTSMAAICFDQSYNFYLRNVLRFPTSGNGYVKAAIGILGLLANVWIGRKMIRKYDLNKGYFMVVFTTLLFNGFVIFTNTLPTFLVISLLYYMAYSLMIPLQQAMIANHKTEGGKLFGLFQSYRALGWITGSLAAGFLYEQKPTLPFVGAFVTGAISLMLIGYMIRLKKKENI